MFLFISIADLLNDLKSFGFFFEDMAVRDLSIYADSFNGELKHYIDSNGLEVDAVTDAARLYWDYIENKWHVL